MIARQPEVAIRHHGGHTTVTGSCHELVLAPGASLLIDCGMRQGRDAATIRPDIDFAVEPIKALVLTHVHLDHVGRVPHLLAAGFNGPIYCSRPTAMLLRPMLEDALAVGVTRDRRLIARVVHEVEKRLVALEYLQWCPLYRAAGVSCAIKLRPAGHILGSAMVECRVRQAGASERRIVFSGDLGAPYAPLLPAPKSPYGCDTLVLESTYGDRLHAGRRQRRTVLRQVLQRALADRGLVLIPAFSMGRTQELLYELEEIIARFGRAQAGPDLAWKDLEILIDSPLAARFTEIYRHLRPYWDREARKRLAQGRHPLSFSGLTTIDSHDEHVHTVNYLAKRRHPCVVVAASGMCSGGRIVNYLKQFIGESATDVVLVGYQAAGTPGREIQEYGPRGGYVTLDGKRYPIRAGVHRLSGYSAHADQADLVRFVRRMRNKPRTIRLVHGEDAARRALAAALSRELGHGTRIV